MSCIQKRLGPDAANVEADANRNTGGSNFTTISGLLQLTDEEREAVIDIYTQLTRQGPPGLRRHFWSMMKAAIQCRSATQIERMERAKNLRIA